MCKLDELIVDFCKPKKNLSKKNVDFCNFPFSILDTHFHLMKQVDATTCNNIILNKYNALSLTKYHLKQTYLHTKFILIILSYLYVRYLSKHPFPFVG